MPTEFLSKDKQYAQLLNNEQISRIADPELRRIRQKYWNLRHEAFLDERKIPDAKLEDEWNRITSLEMDDLKKYREQKGDW